MPKPSVLYIIRKIDVHENSETWNWNVCQWRAFCNMSASCPDNSENGGNWHFGDVAQELTSFK